MEKEKLLGFMKRYNLGGCIESVKVDSSKEDNKIFTRVISEEKHVLGNVTLKNVNFGDCSLGVYDTAKLKLLLGVMGTDVDVSTVESDGRAISVTLKDQNISANFMLSDLSVIPKTPNLKKVPDWDVVIKLDRDFINRFIKAKSALPEANSFTLMMSKKTSELEMVVGFSTINSNRIALNIETETDKDTLDKPISFSAKYFKEILSANLDSKDAKLNVSSQGLAHLNFSADDYESEYYLTEVKQGD